MENNYTAAQREHKRVDLLEEKMNHIRGHLCDKLHSYDNKPKSGGMRFANMAWRLGEFEFLFRYDECPNTPGHASYWIRYQPYAGGATPDVWKTIPTLGQFDAILRKAKKSKVLTANDRKAIELADKHEGETPQHLILVGLTGSQAYGLAHDGYIDPGTGEQVKASDVDTRGVFVVPTLSAISLPTWKAENGIKRLVEQKRTDTKYDELERFIELTMTCNPERLEMLESAKTLETPEGKLLSDARHMFLSKQIKHTYGGYAEQQLHFVEKKVERYTKPAMHLIRLLMVGIKALKEGIIDPDMSEYRDKLLAIRFGDMPMDEVFAWHQKLNIEFAAAAENTKLPDYPDVEGLNKVYLEIRYAHLDWGK